MTRKSYSIVQHPDPRKLNATRKRLPKFNPHDLQPILNAARAVEGQSWSDHAVLEIRRRNQKQMADLLRRLGVDPSQPDAWQRGFFVLAFYHHGVGNLTWRIPRTNRNAATWTNAADLNLLREVTTLMAAAGIPQQRLPMTSNRKIEANRRNGRKSCGPRTAAGKSIASRNALRHGLAAYTHRQTVPSAEIEQFARALCGNDDDPVMFAQAVKIAENEMLLQAIRNQQVAAVERLRERTTVAFARKDNSLEVAKLRSCEAQQAEQEIKARLPELFTKYKNKISAMMERDLPASANSYEEIMDWLADDIFAEGDIRPCIFTELVTEMKPIDNQILDDARKQIEAGQRDEYEALQSAIRDLVGLDRYESRAWSRQKRAIREFISMKASARDVHPTSAVEERVP